MILSKKLKTIILNENFGQTINGAQNTTIEDYEYYWNVNIEINYFNKKFLLHLNFTAYKNYNSVKIFAIYLFKW